jgi:hypothetical protein
VFSICEIGSRMFIGYTLQKESHSDLKERRGMVKYVSGLHLLFPFSFREPYLILHKLH